MRNFLDRLNNGSLGFIYNWVIVIGICLFFSLFTDYWFICGFFSYIAYAVVDVYIKYKKIK